MQQEVKKKKPFNINSQLFNSYSCRVYFFNVIFFWSFSRLGDIESFSIECRKTKPKVITTSNWKKGKYREEPMIGRVKLTKLLKARENNSDQVVFGFRST